MKLTLRHSQLLVISITLASTFLLTTKTSAQSTAGDFRTASSATTSNWNSLSTWQYYDGTSWGAAPHIPTSADRHITISEDISVDVNVSVDEVTFINAKTLTINTGITMTVVDDPNSTTEISWAHTKPKIDVYGTLQINQGAVLSGHTASSSGGTIAVNNGGTVNVEGSIIGNNSSLPSGNYGVELVVNTGGAMNFKNGSYLELWSYENTQDLLQINGGTMRFYEGSSNNLVGKVSTQVYTGGTLIMDPNTSLTGQDFTLSSGGTLQIGSTEGISSSGNTGNIWTTTRSFSPGATYVYNGKENQATGTGLPNDLTGKLIIDNPGHTVTLSAASTIASGGELSLQKGWLETTDANLLTLNDGATAIVNPANTSFVTGPLKKIGNDPFTFPVGDPVAGYHPLTITAPSLVTDAFTVEYYPVNPTTYGDVNAFTIFNISRLECWEIERSGTSNVSVTLPWLPFKGVDQVVATPSSTVIAGLTGGSWTDISENEARSGTTNNGSVTANLTNYSTMITIAGSPMSILPVKFYNVSAVSKPNGILIQWTNLTESDVKHYEIERSSDGKSFTIISKVSPKLNNDGRAEYSWLDTATQNGTITYRIKATETDNKMSFSNTVTVKITPKASGFRIYPNPVVNNVLYIGLPEKDAVVVIIYDAQGKLVKNQNLPSGNIVSINCAELSAGLYYIKVTTGKGKTETKQFIKK